MAFSALPLPSPSLPSFYSLLSSLLQTAVVAHPPGTYLLRNVGLECHASSGPKQLQESTCLLLCPGCCLKPETAALHETF
ncbi:hypothetical protein QBC46DRAFT_378230 [Diplogelasinospora grovesii]|uniref:Uncharacterized protein n=1 Tax=Diplogelasinospora grovesii TaxID=303347 RepID=A0AAN6S7A5_9PEZI|nr:hypothetical protein QBC46DRAFT_378230 [Diplogelasinospora grovesii]